MKTLVIYYSYSGKTRVCAEAIARELRADLQEIKDKKPYRGIWAYIIGSGDAFTGRKIELLSPNYDLTAYDRIVLATPVWAFHTTPAIYTYANNCDFSGKKVFILTTSLGIPGNAMDVLGEIVERRGGKVVGKQDIISLAKSDDVLAMEAVKKIGSFI